MLTYALGVIFCFCLSDCQSCPKAKKARPGASAISFNTGFSQNWEYPSGGPYNKDYSILGSILGSPI